VGQKVHNSKRSRKEERAGRISTASADREISRSDIEEISNAKRKYKRDAEEGRGGAIREKNFIQKHKESAL